MSEELNDTNLMVAHTTQLGEAYRRKGDTATALDLMQSALIKAQKADRATQGYVLQMLAYTDAEAGEKRAFDQHIGAAINLLGHSGESEGAAQRDFIPFEVLEIYGKVMRDFGQPREAIQYLEQAERALMSRPNVPRWQAVLTISKAQALCDAGELEEGVRLAINGLLLAHSCQSPRQINRVRKLVARLGVLPPANASVIAPLRDLVQDISVGHRSPMQWVPQHAM